MLYYNPDTQTIEVAQRTSWGAIDPVTYLPSIFIDSLAGIPEADAKSGVTNDMQAYFRGMAENMVGVGNVVAEAI